MKDNRTKKIKAVLIKGVGEIIEKKSLLEKLRSGKVLRIKYGADPSAPDLHLGHSACLWKLKELQDLGHQIVFIVGDFTAAIGDPSGKTKTRPALSKEEIQKNSRTYFKQVGKILNLKKIKIVKNSQWFGKMRMKKFLEIAAQFTVARILEREDFSSRIESSRDIGFHEIIYPLLQAYDSVQLQADVEVGGTDQKFNLLAARAFQKKTGQEPEDLIIIPLLPGLDGKTKMSKSLGNYIGISEDPENQYGKIMSLPDKSIEIYYELATRASLQRIEKIKKGLKEKTIQPLAAKKSLAREIISLYWGKEKALKAEKEFTRVFKEKKAPKKIAENKIFQKSLNILDLLVITKLASSKAEAKRLVLQGGVKIGGIAQRDWKKTIQIKKPLLVQVGKRRFVKIV